MLKIFNCSLEVSFIIWVVIRIFLLRFLLIFFQVWLMAIIISFIWRLVIVICYLVLVFLTWVIWIYNFTDRTFRFCSVLIFLLVIICLGWRRFLLSLLFLRSSSSWTTLFPIFWILLSSSCILRIAIFAILTLFHCAYQILEAILIQYLVLRWNALVIFNFSILWYMIKGTKFSRLELVFHCHFFFYRFLNHLINCCIFMFWLGLWFLRNIRWKEKASGLNQGS
mgnify:CR=1 FL=1